MCTQRCTLLPSLFSCNVHTRAVGEALAESLSVIHANYYFNLIRHQPLNAKCFLFVPSSLDIVDNPQSSRLDQSANNTISLRSSWSHSKVSIWTFHRKRVNVESPSMVWVGSQLEAAKPLLSFLTRSGQHNGVVRQGAMS